MTETLLERIEQIRSSQGQLCALVEQTKDIRRLEEAFIVVN